MIGDGRETYSDNTLKTFKKANLIEIIRCFESNLRSADETIDIQTKQCEKLIESTKNAYYEKGRADFEAECEKLFDDNPPMHFTREQIMWIKEHIKHDRADERTNTLEELKKMIDDEYCDGGYGDYHEVEMIVRMIEQLRSAK